MAFTSLDIPNFRALRNLRVEELRRVNLLVGKNNSGKTSLLEAVELLCAMPRANEIADCLMTQRYSQTKLESPLSLAFNRKLSGDQSIELYASLHSTGMPWPWIKINIFHSHDTKEYYGLPAHDQANNPSAQISGLVTCSNYFIELSASDTSKLLYLLKVYGPLASRFPIYQHKVMFPTKEVIEEIRMIKHPVFINQIERSVNDVISHVLASSQKSTPTPCHFIPVNFEQNQEANQDILKIAYKNKINKIAKCLQGIDKSIIDIKILDNVVYFDIGAGDLLSKSAMGEGTNRIVRLLASILSLPPGGVCLIDEIDTGLHYTALPVMWRAVLQAAEDNDVQLFVTTHSDECIEALVQVLRERETPLEEADCALYSLEQEEDGTKAYRQNAANVDALISMGLEYR